MTYVTLQIMLALAMAEAHGRDTCLKELCLLCPRGCWTATAPPVSTSISIGGVDVECGAKIPGSDTAMGMRVTAKVGAATSAALFLLLDPDAPGHGVYAHWAQLVTGCNGDTCSASTSLARAEGKYRILDFAPATPPSGTGYHRYAALVVAVDVSAAGGADALVGRLEPVLRPRGHVSTERILKQALEGASPRIIGLSAFLSASEEDVLIGKAMPWSCST